MASGHDGADRQAGREDHAAQGGERDEPDRRGATIVRLDAQPPTPERHMADHQIHRQEPPSVSAPMMSSRAATADALSRVESAPPSRPGPGQGASTVTRTVRVSCAI